jgi:hypothetical protein
MRDWMSSDGRKIRAELMGFEEGSIRLRVEGGQRAVVPVERLSAGDRAELIRFRFSEHYWSESGEAANTRYYYSRQTLSGKTHEGVVALISIGPKRFLFELKVHSATFDLKNYSRLRLQIPGSDHPFGYTGEQVAAWRSGPLNVSRVVVQIPPEDPSGLLPFLKAGLGEGGSLSISAVSDTAGTVDLPISPEERSALADLLSVFLDAQPLVTEGTMKKEPLDGQTFLASVPEPGTAPVMGASPLVGAGFDLLPEETEMLGRLRTTRGGGRLGEVRWTPEGGEPSALAALGWARNRVIVRIPDTELRLVPFSEIDGASRTRALEQRLREFSGPRPVDGPQGTLYFPPGWSDHKREHSQGLVFGRRKRSGEPFLLVQAVANRFGGRPITGIAIRGNAAPGFIPVEIDGAANRVRHAGGEPWSLASMPVETEIARKMAPLADSHALDIQILSGEEVMTFPLVGDHLLVSLEALRCYEWATLIQP